MATIGQQLTSPESGWKRYDFMPSSFKLIGTGWQSNNGYDYGTTTISGAKIIFLIKGTDSLRLLAYTWNNRNNQSIKINGVNEGTYDCRITGSNPVRNTLVYEKTGLNPNSTYTIEIEPISDGNAWFALDSVDIKQEGRILHPDEVTDIKDLDIGKRIRCHYQASSGQVGVFSGLGQETSDFIPPVSSATPNGDFYWICCDIKNGKKILLADRNIQHSISWDKINEQGMTNTGREITF
jgi:hypothetical protein